tara:strand:+ start:159 stop:296 length:138 start_codon:yes stop_codon:yes gene_type:complete
MKHNYKLSPKDDYAGAEDAEQLVIDKYGSDSDKLKDKHRHLPMRR